MKSFTFRNIPDDQLRTLRIMAAEQEISINSLVLKLIDQATRRKKEADKTGKTFAYLIEVGSKALVGYTYTEAKGGEIVAYGEWLPDQGVFHQIGRAKVNRSEKYRDEWDAQKETLPEYDVNYGGGKPV